MSHTKNKNLVYLIVIIFFISCEGEVGPQGIGLNSLTNVTNEPTGTNCENGGVKIEVGIDSNENGVLDSDEIQSTSYVCNGVDGAISLTTVTTEPAGTNCENGGLKINSGIDTNSDGTLDDTEISATAYVCNGIDGNNSLTKITNESAGTNCENGGLKIDSGIDANADGTLDDDEISATAYVCNGIDGSQSLTKISSEESNTICEAGGIKVQSGIDANANSILDAEEITSEEYVCNGDYDKLVRVNLLQNDFGTSSDQWTLATEYESVQLFKFSKLHYTNVDSITFVPTLYTPDTNTKCFVQLYNSTDNLAIEGSIVESNVNGYIYVESNNIYESLPEGEKLITMRVRSETNGIYVSKARNSFIFIYRK